MIASLVSLITLGTGALSYELGIAVCPGPDPGAPHATTDTDSKTNANCLKA